MYNKHKHKYKHKQRFTTIPEQDQDQDPEKKRKKYGDRCAAARGYESSSPVQSSRVVCLHWLC